MQRDWTLELMLKLTMAFESDRSRYLAVLDDKLDEVSFRFAELKRLAVISGLKLARALTLISELRGRLEIVQNSQEIRQAFEDIGPLRELMAECKQAAKDREE